MSNLLSKRNRLPVLILVAAVAIAALVINNRPESYHPVINPADFSTAITNKYFSLKTGKKLTYQQKSEEGTEKVEINIPGETKEIMGVTTLVYWDRVWLDGELIEDTHDYLAQDTAGNVWYFGEDVDNYEDGVLRDHEGSWTAGVDGAQPGIWMLAAPKVGDRYRQEYYRGVAEDQAEVISVSETVTVPAGTFKDCLHTYDWSPLDSGLQEDKYYCPAVAVTVLEVDRTDGAREELTGVK